MHKPYSKYYKKKSVLFLADTLLPIKIYKIKIQNIKNLFSENGGKVKSFVLGLTTNPYILFRFWFHTSGSVFIK